MRLKLKKTKHAPRKSEVPQIKLRNSDVVAKKTISIRVDQDVLDYFKDNHSPGYQTKINEVLRSYMDENEE